MTGLRNYTRWARVGAEVLVADILGSPAQIEVRMDARVVSLNGKDLSPDEARLIGVRLIDGAVLADGPAAIRELPGGGR